MINNKIKLNLKGIEWIILQLNIQNTKLSYVLDNKFINWYILFQISFWGFVLHGLSRLIFKVFSQEGIDFTVI